MAQNDGALKPADAAPRGLRACWRAETGIFLGLWVFLLLVGRSKLFQDPGSFWHTMVGERLLSTRQLIWTDWLTFTFAGRHWIPHQWLGESLMALIHRIGGLDSLLLVTVTVLAGMFTWVASRLLRAGLHWSLAVVLVILVFAASSTHLHVRPHIGTIVFLAMTVGFLLDYEAGRIGVGRLWWLVPIYLAWTSIHGGALGGLATIGLALGGWTLYRLIGWESPFSRWQDFFLCALVLLACALMVPINPYGFWLFRTWRAIMGSETLTRIIIEHHPLQWRKQEAWPVLFLGLLYGVCLLSTLPRRPRVAWLLPAVWLYLACTRIRHAPLFAVPAALAMADMLPFTCWARWLSKTGSDLFQLAPPGAEIRPRRLGWQAWALPTALVLLALGLQASKVETPLIGHNWVQLDPKVWPVELQGELAKHQGDGTLIFNDLNFGGYLIYFTPGYRIFVDDRCELY
ncbi:MAG: hypothetical protein JNM56_35715, partial [Planctomycetia bacterium]|nr:hypothetical protein [Planctomycetia bacterium]